MIVEQRSRFRLALVCKCLFERTPHYLYQIRLGLCMPRTNNNLHLKGQLLKLILLHQYHSTFDWNYLPNNSINTFSGIPFKSYSKTSFKQPLDHQTPFFPVLWSPSQCHLLLVYALPSGFTYMLLISLLIVASFPGSFHAQTKNRKEGEEPVKIYQVRNVVHVGRDNLITCGRIINHPHFMDRLYLLVFKEKEHLI